MRPDGFEISHGRARVHPARLRDLKARPAPAPTKPGKRRRRPNRTAKRSLLAQVRAAAQATAGTEGSRELASTALALYRSAARELHTDSPLALSHLVSWALQTAASQALALQGAQAGIGTREGLQLLERSARAAGRAERACTAALAVAGLLGTRAPKPPASAPWLVPAGSPAGAQTADDDADDLEGLNDDDGPSDGPSGTGGHP